MTNGRARQRFCLRRSSDQHAYENGDRGNTYGDTHGSLPRVRPLGAGVWQTRLGGTITNMRQPARARADAPLLTTRLSWGVQHFIAACLAMRKGPPAKAPQARGHVVKGHVARLVSVPATAE